MCFGQRSVKSSNSSKWPQPTAVLKGALNGLITDVNEEEGGSVNHAGNMKACVFRCVL